MILYIDTTEKNFELRLYKTTGEVVDKFLASSELNHSDELVGRVDQILKQNNSNKADLDRIVVVSGPGSYTGLRVGVATANAMAFALNVPVFGVKSGSEPELAEALKSNASSFSSPARVHYINAPHITTSKR